MSRRARVTPCWWTHAQPEHRPHLEAARKILELRERSDPESKNLGQRAALNFMNPPIATTASWTRSRASRWTSDSSHGAKLGAIIPAFGTDFRVGARYARSQSVCLL